MATHSISMPKINSAAAASKINVPRRRSALNPPPPPEVLPKYVRDYRANSHEVGDGEFISALKARILAATTESAALSSYLTEEELELARFHAQQSEMRAALKSLHSGIAAELDRVNSRKSVLSVLFTLFAASCAASLAIAAGVDDKRPAAAAAAAFATLLLALGKWIETLLNKSEEGVKKHSIIITCMIVSGKAAIEDLAEITALARDMKAEAEAEALSKMIDGGGVEVGKKVAALNRSFQELQRKAIRGGLDASSAREIVLQIILTNLE